MFIWNHLSSKQMKEYIDLFTDINELLARLITLVIIQLDYVMIQYQRKNWTWQSKSSKFSIDLLKGAMLRSWCFVDSLMKTLMKIVKINVFTFEKNKESVSTAIGRVNTYRLNYAVTHKCTKILSKFKVISKLPSVKSNACLSELSGTELEGSIVPINEVAWSAMCETRWRILLFWCSIFYFGQIKLSWHSR